MEGFGCGWGWGSLEDLGPPWVSVLATTVVLFEDDGVDLTLDFLNLKVDIDFFVEPLVMTWAVTGLPTWGDFVRGLTGSTICPVDCALTWGNVWMMNDPGLRTVVGIDMPISDGVIGTLPSTWEGLCSGMLTVRWSSSPVIKGTEVEELAWLLQLLWPSTSTCCEGGILCSVLSIVGWSPSRITKGTEVEEFAWLFRLLWLLLSTWEGGTLCSGLLTVGWSSWITKGTEVEEFAWILRLLWLPWWDKRKRYGAGGTRTYAFLFIVCLTVNSGMLFVGGWTTTGHVSADKGAVSPGTSIDSISEGGCWSSNYGRILMLLSR